VTELRTERLLLRPLSERDVEALVAYRSRVDVCHYVPFTPMSHDDVAERLATQWARTELTDEGQALTLGIEVVESGRLVGDVVLFWHSRLHGGGELGYVINPDDGGHGYATEAAAEMVRFGFEVIGLHRIVARVDERNAASARLLRRLGMREEARLVENEFFKGEWTNELDFAILAVEWNARSSANS
jgi:RimJ/RimL family protein N-acetyltransferase